MKNIFKSVIDRGGYDLSRLLKNIDTYHIEGKLTDADRDELYSMARSGAAPENSADILAKLAELERRVTALEQAGSSGTTGETVAEYVAGKWYYNGDKCLFEGKTYACTAPEGVVCVWSPAEYPAYWEVEA
jgi:hypothetical protein